jgi:hypothetical protein
VKKLLASPLIVGDGNGHKKMVELVVSTTVPVVFVILMAFTYIYIKKAKYKGKFLNHTNNLLYFSRL